jgi:hypothetical protein
MVLSIVESVKEEKRGVSEISDAVRAKVEVGRRFPFSL